MAGASITCSGLGRVWAFLGIKCGPWGQGIDVLRRLPHMQHAAPAVMPRPMERNAYGVLLLCERWQKSPHLGLATTAPMHHSHQILMQGVTAFTAEPRPV